MTNPEELSDKSGDSCDQHARQVAIPHPVMGALWICQTCLAICGQVDEEALS